MHEKSTLYWSHIKMYEQCPQKFLWTKGWNGIDLGNGDGKPKTVTKPTSRHAAIMGIAIHHAIELFYNNEIWREGKKTSELLCKLATDEFNKLCSKMYIDFELAQQTQEQMLEVVLNGVRGFVQTCKHNRLLGPYAKGEVRLMGWVNNYTSLGGIIDIILRNDDLGVVLLDGKNARVKDFVDEDQLHFYGYLYKLSFHKTPDRLGFLWFRYPHNTETQESGITWVDVDVNKFVELEERVNKVKKGMWKKKFPAKASRDACIFCDFKDQCEEYQVGERMVKKAADTIKTGSKDSGFGDFSL